MSSTLVPPQSREGLQVLDPDLPFLATEAAVDIDNLLSHRSRELDAIQRLAERLKNSIVISSIAPPRSNMDPVTINVLSEAVAKTLEDYSSPKVEDLLVETDKIADKLSRADKLIDKSELIQARDFCIALSRATANYRNSIQELRPSHPFRR